MSRRHAPALHRRRRIPHRLFRQSHEVAPRRYGEGPGSDLLWRPNLRAVPFRQGRGLLSPLRAVHLRSL